MQKKAHSEVPEYAFANLNEHQRLFVVNYFTVIHSIARIEFSLRFNHFQLVLQILFYGYKITISNLSHLSLYQV